VCAIEAHLRRPLRVAVMQRMATAIGNALKLPRISTHGKGDRPVFLYKKKAFCKQSRIIVGNWNARFSKWRDDGGGLFEHDDFSHRMESLRPPET
jgi:hypothetical protein